MYLQSKCALFVCVTRTYDNSEAMRFIARIILLAFPILPDTHTHAQLQWHMYVYVVQGRT